MEFGFSPEEEAFRQKVRAFLKQELPADWEGREAFEEAGEEQRRFARAFVKRLAQQGWLCMAWPKEYGGGGATHVEQLIFKEESGYAGAPAGDVFGVGMAGPTLIVFGTEAQKKQHLPGIASAEVIWCQGFSEPGAGSDLASLQTKAVEQGDYFVVNGQKIWSTGAHQANWMFMLCRTDPEAPRHRGISYLLVDMKTPGITVRPLVNAVNSHDFNEVFFDEVKVPRENLVGDKNAGWYVAAATLDFERSSIGDATAARRSLERMVQWARDTKVDGVSVYDDPTVRAKLAEMAIEIEISRMLSYRVTWMQAQGIIPNYEASEAKLFASELLQRLANAGMQMMGLAGQLWRDPRGPLSGRMPVGYVGSIGITLAGGTSEIQRNIIAQRGLGLPR